MNTTEASYVRDAYSELLQRAARALDDDGVSCATSVDSLELLDGGMAWVDYAFNCGSMRGIAVFPLDRLCDK